MREELSAKKNTHSEEEKKNSTDVISVSVTQKKLSRPSQPTQPVVIMLEKETFLAPLTFLKA